MRSSPEDKHSPPQNYETRHTNNPYMSVNTQRASHESNNPKVNTPMQRSTQAYYDSEQSKRRSRNNTHSTPPQRYQQVQPRTFRHYISFLAYPDREKEFVAYCVAVKESNSGIFSHQRFLVLDSVSKELRYYSDIPQLPLQSLTQLKAPKQVIKLDPSSKISYQPTTGIGQVLISCIDASGKKQWSLTMGSRKMVRQFGVVLEQIRKNQYISAKQLKRTLAHMMEEAYENKGKKIDTPFISQIKELQKRDKSSQRSDSLRNSRKKEEKIKKERRLSSVYSIKVEGSSNSELAESRAKEEIFKDKQQIQLERIIEAAEVQHRSKSKTVYIKNFDEPSEPTQLQKVLQRRKEATDESQIKLQIPTQQLQLGSSKIMVKKMPQLLPPKPKPKTPSSKKDTSPPDRSIKQSRFTASYEESQRQYRAALLEERRQAYAALAKNKVNRHSHPISQSPSKVLSSSSQLPQSSQKWLVSWLRATKSHERGLLYASFLEHCVKYLNKLTSNFEDWHLFHKNDSDLYVLEEQFVEYSYFMLVEQNRVSELKQKERQMELQFRSFDYILNCLSKDNDQLEKVNVPLCCIVQMKGFKFFCKAALIPEIIKESLALQKNIHEPKIVQLENKTKITLRECEFVELQMDGSQCLYIRKSQIMPKVFKNAFVSWSYISKFIKQGNITNDLDLQSIEEHIDAHLLPEVVEQVERAHILSCVELDTLLQKIGLNMSLLPELYARAQKGGHEQTQKRAFSELMSDIIVKKIRQNIHSFLLEKNITKDITTVIIAEICKFLLNPQTYSQKQFVVQSNQHFDFSYILASLFYKLGMNLEIKHRTDITMLQSIYEQYWQEVDFSSHNFNILFSHRVEQYQYLIFNDSYRNLCQEVLDVKVEKIRLAKEDVVKMLTHSSEIPYSQSYIYKLLPIRDLEKVKVVLSCYQGPYQQKIQPPLAVQNCQLYHNLLYRPTSSFLTKQNFMQSLTGIKWFIKFKNKTQASLYLHEQLQRALIWCKEHPLLIDLYDMLTQLSLQMGRSTDSIACSLKAFQMSIKCYGSNFFQQWQSIWQRAFVTANIHYEMGKYETSLDLYNTAADLLSKISSQDLKISNISPSFMELYRKRIIINLALCRIEQAVSLCYENLQRLKRYLFLFTMNADIFSTFSREQFETNLLLLRCFEISRQWSKLMEYCGWCWAQFVESQLKLITKNTLTIKTNHFCQYKIKELTKYAWVAMVSNVEELNSPGITSTQGRIDLLFVRRKLEQIMRENHSKLHYSFDEVYKHMTDLILDYFKQEDSQEKHITKKVRGSYFMTHLLKILRQLQQNRYFAERCKIYDKQAKSNNLLFLECLSHLTTYQYAIGSIAIQQHDYCF